MVDENTESKNMAEENDNQLKYLSEALFGNILIQRESISSIGNSLKILQKEFSSDISQKEMDLTNLSYIARDVRDNFQFTLSIIDEIGSIDELINQLNILALNISIEASKIEGEDGEIFTNLAKEVREKGDKVQGVIERIFLKEIRNKSFSEHNRYIKNSILPQINERVESLGQYFGNREDVVREFQKAGETIDELQILSSGNKTILSGIINFTKNVDIQEYKEYEKPQENIAENSIENIVEPEIEVKIEKKVEEKVLNKTIYSPLGIIKRGTRSF